MDRRSCISASVISPHQSDAVGDTAPVPCMAIVPGMVLVVFSGMIGLTLRKELLEKAASLGSSDRHGSLPFSGRSERIPSDPAVYRCHDSMECRLCDTGTA